MPVLEGVLSRTNRVNKVFTAGCRSCCPTILLLCRSCSVFRLRCGHIGSAHYLTEELCIGLCGIALYVAVFPASDVCQDWRGHKRPNVVISANNGRWLAQRLLLWDSAAVSFLKLSTAAFDGAWLRVDSLLALLSVEVDVECASFHALAIILWPLLTDDGFVRRVPVDCHEGPEGVIEGLVVLPTLNFLHKILFFT